MENYIAHHRNVDRVLEGARAAQSIGDLALGEWRKYGPYAVTVNDGILNVDVLRASKGEPLLMGIALYSVPGSQPNQAPQVTVTSPVSGTAFVSGATVAMTAAASDSDGSTRK